MLHFSPRIIFLSWNSLRVIVYRVRTYMYVHMYEYRCIFPLNPTYLPRASAFHEFHRGFYFFQSSILSYASCHFAFNFFPRLSWIFFLHSLSPRFIPTRIQSFSMRNLQRVIFGNYPFHYILLLRKIYFWETYNLIYVYSEFSFIHLWINLKWQAIFIVKFIIIKIYTKMYKKFSDKTIRILLLSFIKFG